MCKEDTWKCVREVPELMRRVEDCERGVDGFQEYSVFNQLHLFNQIESGGVDLMHDITSGILHYNICEALFTFIYNRIFFGLDKLNYRKKSFVLSENETRFASSTEITRDVLMKRKLRMTSAEMHSFVHHLPLLIGDIILLQNLNYWKSSESCSSKEI